MIKNSIDWDKPDEAGRTLRDKANEARQALAVCYFSTPQPVGDEDLESALTDTLTNVLLLAKLMGPTVLEFTQCLLIAQNHAEFELNACWVPPSTKRK